MPVYHSVLNVKALVGFQPGDSPSRGLLRDCEIFGNLRIAFVSSSIPGPGARPQKIPRPRHPDPHSRAEATETRSSVIVCSEYEGGL